MLRKIKRVLVTSFFLFLPYTVSAEELNIRLPGNFDPGYTKNTISSGTSFSRYSRDVYPNFNWQVHYKSSNYFENVDDAQESEARQTLKKAVKEYSNDLLQEYDFGGIKKGLDFINGLPVKVNKISEDKIGVSIRTEFNGWGVNLEGNYEFKRDAFGMITFSKKF